MPETNDMDLDGYIAVLDAYREADAQVRDWGARKAELRDQLLGLLGHCDRGRLDGQVVVRRTRYNGREYVDTKALRRRFPDVAASCIAYTKPYDALTLVST